MGKPTCGCHCSHFTLLSKDLLARRAGKCSDCWRGSWIGTLKRLCQESRGNTAKMGEQGESEAVKTSCKLMNFTDWGVEVDSPDVVGPNASLSNVTLMIINGENKQIRLSSACIHPFPIPTHIYVCLLLPLQSAPAGWLTKLDKIDGLSTWCVEAKLNGKQHSSRWKFESVNVSAYGGVTNERPDFYRINRHMFICLADPLWSRVSILSTTSPATLFCFPVWCWPAISIQTVKILSHFHNRLHRCRM